MTKCESDCNFTWADFIVNKHWIWCFHLRQNEYSDYYAIDHPIDEKSIAAKIQKNAYIGSNGNRFIEVQKFKDSWAVQFSFFQVYV